MRARCGSSLENTAERRVKLPVLIRRTCGLRSKLFDLRGQERGEAASHLLRDPTESHHLSLGFVPFTFGPSLHPFGLGPRLTQGELALPPGAFTNGYCVARRREHCPSQELLLGAVSVQLRLEPLDSLAKLAPGVFLLAHAEIVESMIQHRNARAPLGNALSHGN